jgi:hypothetical protein
VIWLRREVNAEEIGTRRFAARSHQRRLLMDLTPINAISAKKSVRSTASVLGNDGASVTLRAPHCK